MSQQPDYNLSWEFLDKLHPGRLRVITGVSLDKKSIPTETFKPDEKARFLEWIAACGKMPANIYYSMAEPTGHMRSKMNRNDVRSVWYLHVDLDPEPGKDLIAEQDRILNLLRNPPEGVLPPTWIVYSGGGYQAGWKLREPAEINGDMAIAEAFKYYNIQLERLLNGDGTHDVCRIMRLPGTLNIPDEKKLKKGRTVARAELIEWHNDRVYDLKQFVKAPMVQDPSCSTTSKVQAPGNVKRLASVDELGDRVTDLVKIYIVQGEHPDDPSRFPSRSEMLFWVCCELVRAGIEDETIYSVLTDPEFGISESVLEKGNNAQRYALRQIERARDQAIDPMLRELNERHAVIGNFGGKCVVIEEMFDESLKRFRLTKQGFDHFRNRYMNKMVTVGKNANGESIERPAGDWWLKHPQRRQYNKIIFSPSRDVEDAYNLWRGFACDAQPGDCSKLLDHIKQIACGGDEELYNYFIGWMANTVQNPGEPGHSAVVMRGRQGCGKSIIPSLFGEVFGRHYIMVNNSRHLVGQFNAHLRDCVLLFADEAFFAGDKSNESVLKTIVTEPMLTFEMKGVDAEPSANCVHLMMASNEKWVVPASFDDRRYFVLDCLPDRIGDKAYFDAIVQQFHREGGREALLHFLLSYDLSKFNVRGVPKTDALQAQKALSMDPEVEWWLNALRRGTALPEHSSWATRVPCDLLAIDYLNYIRTFNMHRRSSGARFFQTFEELVPSSDKFQSQSPTAMPKGDGTTVVVQRPWFFSLPSLQECRDHFDKHFGGPYKWTGELPDEDLPDYGKIFE